MSSGAKRRASHKSELSKPPVKLHKFYPSHKHMLPHVMDKIQVKHSHQSMLQDRRLGLAKTMQFYSLFIFVVQRPGSSPFDACHKDQCTLDYCHEISKPTDGMYSSLCQSPRQTMYKH
ncbi:hypothetical protein BTVI_88697 [Pitangus sulphuratus]|nr:hypothetical protein BTVI_88697 [Pitangus sulphuratus]